MTSVLVAAVLVGVAAVRWVVPDPTAVELWASTNLVNLHQHPFSAFVASAFVSTPRLHLDILFLAVSCGIVEFAAGGRRMLAVVAAGHVIATVLTEGAVCVAILLGNEASDSAWRMDVGVSYALYTAVGAALLYAPRRLRPAAAVLVGGYLCAQLATSWDMTAWGHVLSLLIGICSWPLLLSATARPPAVPTRSFGAARRAVAVSTA